MKSPVYRYSFHQAEKWNELDAWGESLRKNIECKEKIEKEIIQNYNGEFLDSKKALLGVMERFSAERIAYVLANTVHHKLWDSRFSIRNKSWANSIPVLDHNTHNEYDRTHCYVVDGCNSGLVDLLIDEFLKIEGTWELF